MLPLSGYRIVDLSTVLSGPLAAALLADQGADVIKVEQPEGDSTRWIGPSKPAPGQPQAPMSAMYIAANRGKRGIALDLKQPAAIGILHRLLARADVMLSNYRPGVLERLGLPDAELTARYPTLVRLEITGFGEDGPRAFDKAYDAVIQAVGGMSASHRNPVSGDPHLLATAVADKLTAQAAAQAATAALLARSRHPQGHGQRVQVSMLDAVLHFQWADAMYNHVFVDPAPPFPEFGATQKPWACADGFVATMAPQQAEFRGQVTALGAPELADDPRFATLPLRSRHAAELRQAIEPLMARFTRAELEAAFRQHGAPLGVVNERAQVLRDPQVQHNASVQRLAQGAGVGEVQLARAAARFDGQAAGPAGPAPRLGEHGPALLAELGCSAAEIDAWVAQRVLIVPPA